jgi:hypothetical protein
MATTTILQLPQASSLTGAELFELAVPVGLPGNVQGWASERVSTAQIAALVNNIIASIPTGVVYAAPIPGANNNYTAGGQMGAAVAFIDLTPTVICNITGLQAGFDGQTVIITNLSAFAMTLNALNVGSIAANQFRLPGDLILTQNDSKSFKYSATIGKWVAL